MSFNTGLSGLNAASADLATISNNIANVNTTGFKYSRAEFGDIYANSVYGTNRTSIGAGVILEDVAQQFSQGNLSFTSNSLDMAINGEGFFVLSPSLGSGEKLYTRAGEFGVNADGFVVNSSGQYLQAFDVNPVDGTVISNSLGSLKNLQLNQTTGAPQQTANIGLGLNLNANDALLSRDTTRVSDGSAITVSGAAGFDLSITSPKTYNESTSVSFYDSLGNSHVATYYFVKDTTPNKWAVFMTVDGQNVDIKNGANDNDSTGANSVGGQNVDHLHGEITFGPDGKWQSQSPASFISEQLGAEAGIASFNQADPTQTLTTDFQSNNITQLASATTITKQSQDGFGVGQLTGIDIDQTGVVRANFSNGQFTALGKVALARFPNPQGLRQMGNTEWSESLESGAALPGEATTATFGSIRSGALENSNVDLTAQLVGLIQAQRNFQANAKSIETANTTTQAILQIR